MSLTHIDAEGNIHMVDVGEKPNTAREAVAKGEVTMKPATLQLISNQDIPKGDVLTTAKLAGIMAAKKTAELIPLCHQLPLTKIDVSCDIDEKHSRIAITSRVRTFGRTGVEMEALTAVSVAALTIYDMAKSVEKTMRITNIRLAKKSGGKSGDIVLEADDEC